MIHPDDLPNLQQYHRALLTSDQPAQAIEFRILTKSGQVRWLRAHARSRWDAAQGRAVSIGGAAQDITERKQAEEALAWESHVNGAIAELSTSLLPLVLHRNRDWS